MTPPTAEVAASQGGVSIEEDAWPRRHRFVLWALGVHLPALLVLGLVAQWPLPVVIGCLAAVLGAFLVAVLASSRMLRSTAATLGLLLAGSGLVLLTDGSAIAHMHVFVALALVALYQDWRPLVVAAGYVIAADLTALVFAPEVLFAGADGPARAAALHTGFVLAACGAHLLLWRHADRQQRAAHEYYIQLYEGERALVSQLRQTQMVKDELVGVVGHEFRTPLTTIQGFARTLEARYERMDREAVQTCTQAIERESKKLTRMVANLLVASEEVKPSPGDRCALDDTVDRVVRDIVETTPVAAKNIPVHIPRAHVVRMAGEPAYQVLFNLIDNAVKFAAPETDVRVTSRGEGDMIVLEVSNVGTPIDANDRDRIFDAFVQADSSTTRRHGGMGLGLHIARKIVTAYGGRIGVFGEGPVVIFRVWLPRASDDHARADAMPKVAIDLDSSHRSSQG